MKEPVLRPSKFVSQEDAIEWIDTASDGSKKPQEQQRALYEDLRRWRTRALDDVKAVKPFRRFDSDIIPEPMYCFIEENLQRCSTADEVRTLFGRETLERHLAGKHDQMTHGRKGSVGITADDLNYATLHPFGETKNDTFKTTIKGKEYFVKFLAEQGDALIEATATKVANAMGLEHLILPVELSSFLGKPCLVSPWAQGMSLEQMMDHKSEQELNQMLADIPTPQFTTMHAFEYLMADGDRYSQNYFFDTKDNTLKLADTGYSFRNPGTSYAFEENMMVMYRKDGMGISEGAVPLDQGALREVARKSSALKTVVYDSGLDQAKVSQFYARLSVIKQLSTMKNPTIQDLYNLANANNGGQQ